VTVIDTAGIHETRDPVEKGAPAYAAEAELLLWLVDASRLAEYDAILAKAVADPERSLGLLMDR
jgi:tRNA U34 5-carboxymethylaminomethyl modifying GTPase MnmE/TrmE